MRVLVAGGTGVIGRQLVPLLAEIGSEVIVLARAGSTIDVPGARVVEADALDRRAVGEIGRDGLRAELQRQCLERLGAAPAEDQLRTAAGQRPGDRLSEAATGTSEENARSIELHGRHHRNTCCGPYVQSAPRWQKSPGAPPPNTSRTRT